MVGGVATAAALCADRDWRRWTATVYARRGRGGMVGADLGDEAGGGVELVPLIATQDGPGPVHGPFGHGTVAAGSAALLADAGEIAGGPLLGEAPGTCDIGGGALALVVPDGFTDKLAGSLQVTGEAGDFRAVERRVAGVPGVIRDAGQAVHLLAQRERRGNGAGAGEHPGSDAEAEELGRQV